MQQVSAMLWGPSQNRGAKTDFSDEQQQKQSSIHYSNFPLYKYECLCILLNLVQAYRVSYTIISVFIECLASAVTACDAYTVDEILSQPRNDCFLGLEFIAGMGTASPKEKQYLFFWRGIFVKQKILAIMMNLQTSNNEESRIIVKLSLWNE